MKVFLVLISLAALACGYVAVQLYQPYQGFQGEKFVDIPKGTSSDEMAALLEGAGVVKHSWLFDLARALSRRATLQAGEYKFDKPASTMDVFDRIMRGDVFYYELVVPEGNNIFDIAASIKKLGTFSPEKFLEAARNAQLIRDLDPMAPSLEGYLFPNTYRLQRNTTPHQLCQSMVTKFRETWKGLQTSADPHTTITLASMVEREARLPAERPMVAAVFRNRLKIGMKLDCDPTTVYAALLEDRYRGAIHRSDLENTNPYNTYVHSGLPPGPIANPGLSSIKAALEPADSSYLYFVAKADGSGGHNFSESLAQHESNITQYRRNSGH